MALIIALTRTIHLFSPTGGHDKDIKCDHQGLGWRKQMYRASTFQGSKFEIVNRVLELGQEVLINSLLSHDLIE